MSELLHCSDNGITKLSRPGFAAQITGEVFALGDDALHGFIDDLRGGGGCRIIALAAQPSQQHLARHNHGVGVGDVLARDVGGRAVRGLRHRLLFATYQPRRKPQSADQTNDEPQVRKPVKAEAVSPAIELVVKPGTSVAEAWNQHFVKQNELLDSIAGQEARSKANRDHMAAVRSTARLLADQAAADMKTNQDPRRFNDLIAMINAALRNGEPQAWMYDAMSIALQATNAPKSEIERTLMSAVDFASSDEEVLYVANYMSRLGLDARALKLFKSIAISQPYRPEPYVNGLKCAQAADDLAGIEWACVGLLSQAWPKEHREIGENARRVMEATLLELGRQGKESEAKAFKAACQQAMQRDCVIVVNWTGDADVDVVVEEPSGAICSLHNPRSTGGGVLLGDNFARTGASAVAGNSEVYVCANGFSGDYRVLIKKVWGKVTAGHVTVEIFTHYGSKDQTYLKKNIALGAKDALVTFQVKDGRRQDVLAEQQVAQVAKAQLNVNRAVLAQQLGGGDSNSLRDWALAWRRNPNVGRFGVNGPGAVGYRPVIQTFRINSPAMDAQAIISADRRYVRFSMLGTQPISSDIRSVDTFNFVSGQGGQQGGHRAILSAASFLAINANKNTGAK